MRDQGHHMVRDTTTRSPGRPVDEAKRAAILEAAKAEILAAGFEAAAIETVAARARVSKATVYRQYVDKTGLLAAIVEQESERLLERIHRLSHGSGTLSERLIAFGDAMTNLIGGAEHRALEAVIEQEAVHHPQLARRFFASGPARLHAALADILAEAAAAGEIEVQDAGTAAEHLIGLLLGFAAVRRRFLPLEPDQNANPSERVSEAVALFLRAHRKERQDRGVKT